MQFRKILVLFVVLVTVAGAIAYEDSGDSGFDKPITECNDEEDNDGDGKTDGDDPGCADPLYEDDSEKNMYDMDMSWILSGDSAPSKTGPSIFFGSEVVEKGDSDSPYKDESGDLETEIVEWYVEDSDGEWGGGDPKEITRTVSDAVTVDRDNDGHNELVTNPSDASTSQCGDGLQDPGSGEDKVSCPEDYGMTDVLLETSIDIPTQDSQEVYYDVEDENDQLKCQELSDSTYESPDVSDGKDHVFSVAGKTGSPDFIVDKGGLGSGNDDRILSVSCTSDSSSKTKIGEVTDHYLTSSQVDVPGNSATAWTQNGIASSEQSTYCTSTSQEDEAGLDTGIKPMQADANIVGVQQDAGTGGAKEEYTDHQVSIDVIHDDPDSDGGKGYTACDATNKYYDNCDFSHLDDTTCSEYEKNVNELNQAEKNTGVSSRTVDIYYRDYELITSEHYDVSKESDAVGTVTGSNDAPEEYDNSDFVFSNGAFFTDKSDKSNNFMGGNDPAVSRSAFQITVPDGLGGEFQATRDEYLTLDADGPNGSSDGFVAIDEDAPGNHIRGTSSNFLEREVSQGSITNDYVSTSFIPEQDCQGSKLNCVNFVDVYTKQTGWSSKIGDVVGLDFVSKGPFSTSESLGVCKRYKSMTNDWSLTCQYEPPNCDDGDCDRPPPKDSCGDEAGEYWAYMEGPEVNEEVLDDNLGDYQACIDIKKDDISKSACVDKGDVVPEGTVENVAPKLSDKQYESGGNSPDAEVCLDLEGTGISPDGDEEPGDNRQDDINKEDFGGEWYDLDSEAAQEYLRNEGSNLVSDIPDGQLKSGSVYDSNSDGDSDNKDIDFYWRQNLNPFHSNYNPEGSSEGTALEDDCGNSRFDNMNCNDAEQRPFAGDTRQATFYSFFNEDKRDDDYHPRGENVDTEDNRFSGYIVKLKDMSDQLESGMATTNFYTSSTPDPVIWNNSDGSQDAADQWAIAESRNWSLSSRGVPYPPWGTYYRDSASQRTDPGEGSTDKTQKAFGNSYAAVADTTLTDDNGNTVNPGDGVWIDPDYIRKAWHSDDFRWDVDDDGEAEQQAFGNWTDMLNFKMDITGPDSGLGFDTGDGAEMTFKGSSGNERAVVWGDIYFQGEEDEIDNDGDGDGTEGYDEGPSQENWEGTDSVGETVTQIEPPMCGDDQKEFFIEEMGESKRSPQYTGMYACVRTSDMCVDMSSTPRTVEKGSYSQTNEPDENVGRLKNDVEVCEQRPEDDTALWYDQDFGDIDGDGEQDTCRVNNLYGERGVSWIGKSYVQNHPGAVTGGIDDDWNQYIENNYDSGDTDEYTNRYISKPNQNSWDFDTESPVDSGARAVDNNSIATLGFCGGDDDGEYLVTQECNTNLCETDRDIVGVAKNPGSCVLEPSTLSSGYSVDTDERKLHSPGDEVEITVGSETRNIACFDGRWYEDGPIVFNQNNVEVPFGDSATTSFSVINVRQASTTFDVEMIDPLTDNPSAYQFSTFVQKSGDSFETTVEPQSAKTFYVEIEGATKAIGDDSQPSDDELTVRASALNRDVSDQDVTTVEVVENNATNSSSTGQKESRSVPGIGAVQIMFLIMLSSMMFFLQS